MTDFEKWKAKYYPVEASDKVSDLEALKEALLKYEGVRPEVLAEYRLYRHWRDIYDMAHVKVVENKACLWTKFALNGATCSLCKKHMNMNMKYGTGDFWIEACGKCPLNTLETNCNLDKSPWRIMCDEGNVDPIIEKLKELIEIEEEKIENN